MGWTLCARQEKSAERQSSTVVDEWAETTRRAPSVPWMGDVESRGILLIFTEIWDICLLLVNIMVFYATCPYNGLGIPTNRVGVVYCWKPVEFAPPRTTSPALQLGTAVVNDRRVWTSGMAALQPTTNCRRTHCCFPSPKAQSAPAATRPATAPGPAGIFTCALLTSFDVASDSVRPSSPTRAATRAHGVVAPGMLVAKMRGAVYQIALVMVVVVVKTCVCVVGCGGHSNCSRCIDNDTSLRLSFSEPEPWGCWRD